MKRTLMIEGYDDDMELYAGTIIVDGEPMRVWVDGEMADGAQEGTRHASADMADDVPF